MYCSTCLFSQSKRTNTMRRKARGVIAFFAVVFTCFLYLVTVRRVLNKTARIGNRSSTHVQTMDSVHIIREPEKEQDSMPVSSKMTEIAEATSLRKEEHVNPILFFISPLDTAIPAFPSSIRREGQLQRSRVLLLLVQFGGGERQVESLEPHYPSALDRGGE